MKINLKQAIGIVITITILIVIIVGVVFINYQKNNKEDIADEQYVREDIEETEEQKYIKELEDGTKINISEEFNKPKTYKGLEISNIQFTEKDGMSVLLADVENVSNKDHEVEIVKITLLGENGKEIAQINPVIGNVVPGDKIKLNASITADVVNAKDFKIESK